MYEIIKYQLKGRKNSILFMLAVFAIVNAVAWVVEVHSFTSWMHTMTANGSSFGFESRMSGLPAILGFWVPVSIAATVIPTLVMFFLCCSGHVNELLFRDSSYLMLTVPRRGWEIIGGRLIAGFIEFACYALPALFILSIHAAIGGVYATQGGTGFFAAIGFIYGQVFVANFGTMLTILLLGIIFATSIGALIMFAAVASRSFIKTKRLATAIAIAVFIVVCNWTVKIGDAVSAYLDWYVRIPLSLDTRCFRQGWIPDAAASTAQQVFTVPLAPFLIFFVIAAGLFAAAAWLMEKKVEL